MRPRPWHSRIDAQFDCISTPAEYAAAFEARSPRCVSDELFGRLSWGPTVAAATAEDTSSRLAYSFAGADVLAKLLRVGYPNASGAPGGPAAASGLLRAGTGAAVLQLAGVSPERWDASQVGRRVKLCSWPVMARHCAYGTH